MAENQEMKIRIAWMYPDTLYLHGERGNSRALVRYARHYGFEVELERVELGRKGFDPMKYDILFFGPGEISSFETIMNDIGNYSRTLAEFISAGKTMIVTGTTVAMFGERITRSLAEEAGAAEADEGAILIAGEREIMAGLCMLPLNADERDVVFGDDEWIVAEYNGKQMELIGNQIMMVDIDFGECTGYRRFGSLKYGRGNNGTDGAEGIVYSNSIFTNMLGPVLITNPWLTAEILRKVAEVKGYTITAEDPSFLPERESFRLKKEFIEEKMGN